VTLARFGTDGVRGLANEELTADVAMALGRATARVIPATTFLIGRDTRRSGTLIQAALAAGLATEGADVIDLGVIPTPGVAYLGERRELPAAVVSASHNPFADNGIKVFGTGGSKLPLATEAAIEAAMDAILADPDGPPRRPTGHGVGRISVDERGPDEYRVHLESSLEGRRLDGLHVVLDCANGASSAFAPGVFRSLGARVTAISCEPDGANINDGCGSTSPDRVANAVVAGGADLGLAFDGDADRLVAVDHTGAIADGDTLLALFAIDLAAHGRLAGNTVVVTVMTNLGFRRAMAERDIAVRETSVGDRHVLAAIDAEGLSLGGEQSGHIIFRQRATTGDGMLTGLILADLLLRHGASLAALSDGVVVRVPQRLVNVAAANPGRLAECPQIWEAVAEIEDELGDAGRVLLRPSGTEPLVRIMVEASDPDQLDAIVERLSVLVREVLGPVTH